jgi:DNA repair protein SbcC/Rad50
MNLFLKELRVTNFKGIKHISIDFKQVTNIYGANGTGKTSVVPDALNWLLTGKDAQGRADFEIKNTKDTSLNRGEHIVEGVFLKDAELVTLKHAYKEVWTTRKGEDTPVFDGHTHLYEVDGVPKSKKEYFDIVGSIIAEHILKLVTNPLFFPTMPWQDQRNLLIDMAGKISHTEVLDKIVTTKNKGDYQGLINFLNSSTTITNKVAEYKKQVASKLKNIKDEHVTIAPKIEENIRNKPQPVSEAAVRIAIDTLQAQIDQVNSEIHDTGEADLAEAKAVQDIKKNIAQFNSKITEISQAAETAYNSDVFKSKQGLTAARNALRQTQENMEAKQQLIDSKNRRLTIAQQEKATISKKWDEVNESELEINENDFVCSTCKRPLDEAITTGKKTEMITAFNDRKNLQLDQIEASGARLNAEIEALNKDIQLLQTDKDGFTDLYNEQQEEVNNLNTQLQNNDAIITVAERLAGDQEYQKLQADFKAESAKLENRPGKAEKPELRAKLAELTRELDGEKAKLHVNTQIETIEARIEELKVKERELAQQIASLDRENFAIGNYIVAQVDAIQDRINAKFELVTFKLFDKQLNGAINPACECVMDGVPFNMLNTGSKLNAGLDIVNALSGHYNVYAPIVADNRESVHTIIKVNAQMINLFVSESDKTLRID